MTNQIVVFWIQIHGITSDSVVFIRIYYLYSSRRLYWLLLCLGCISTLAREALSMSQAALIYYDYAAISSLIFVFASLSVVTINNCKRIYNGKRLLSIRYKMIVISILGMLSILIFALRFYVYRETPEMKALVVITFNMFIMCAGILPFCLLKLISAMDARLTPRRMLMLKIANLIINAFFCIVSCIIYFYAQIEVYLS